MKRLVLLGGGHAHVHVLKAIGDALDPAVSVTLVTPVDRQVYSGMLPGYVAGHYPLEACGIDLLPLAQRARAMVVRSAASLVNPSMREVICANGEVVGYDVLSIDVGAVPFAGAARGVDAHAVDGAGRIKIRLGIARKAATCSTGWWVGPSSPTPILSCVNTQMEGYLLNADNRIAGRM